MAANFQAALWSLDTAIKPDWKQLTAGDFYEAAERFGELYFDLSDSMEMQQLVVVRHIADGKTAVYRVTVEPQPRFRAFKVSSTEY